MATASKDNAPTSAKAKAAPKAAAAKKAPSAKTSAALAAMTDPVREQAGGFAGKAGDKAREYANKGKDRATGALDEVSEMIGSVASTIDEKVGVEYGDYVRKAAETVSGVADSLKTKDVDDLVADVRTFVKEKPAVAIGAAATLGFILTRIAKAGSSDRDDA
jgi:ElaB/YqjD/DUF883 family membrane-anchored ribosome-binding protein